MTIYPHTSADTPEPSLTEAERAALDLIDMEENEWPAGTNVELAQAIVAAVAPIIKRETLDRFGDRMGTFNHPRPECPDLFCMGWKDSGICPNEPLYRHNP
jgi:hypothetical protein